MSPTRCSRQLETKGVTIDGYFHTNLRCADDIFVCTETPQELQQMLQEKYSDESRRMGIKMNIAKTKVMVLDNTPIKLNNELIENVEGCLYLGHHYSLKEKSQDKEIFCSIFSRRSRGGGHAVVFRDTFIMIVLNIPFLPKHLTCYTCITFNML